MQVARFSDSRPPLTVHQAEGTRNFPSVNRVTSNLNAPVPRLIEALSDVLATPESIHELFVSAGEEIVNQCVDLRTALQKKVTSTTAKMRPSSGDSGCTGGASMAPAFGNKNMNRNRELPPLPLISNSALLSQVFTHSACLDAHHCDPHSAANLSYERLEFIGDAYIECIASRIIFTRFPLSGPGKLSQIRESLVKNETLARYAVSYGLDRKIEIPPAVRKGMASKSWTKILGDVFEAYVAAIVLSSPDTGFAQAESWLASLWEDKLAVHDRQELNPHAKSEIMKKLMGRCTKIEFREEREQKILKKEGRSKFFIGAYLTGWGWENQHLGSGEGYSKGEAGTRAAMNALENVPLVDEIAAVKKAFDEEEKARRKLEDSGAKSQASCSPDTTAALPASSGEAS